MTLQWIGIAVCILLVLVAVVVCMAHADGRNEVLGSRIRRPSKDTNRGHDIGWWT